MANGKVNVQIEFEPPTMGGVDIGQDFTWRRRKDGSWRVGYGASDFLVAEGSAWSLPIGLAFYDALRGANGA